MSAIRSMFSCSALLLAGCAAPVDVRSVGSGPANQAFEMRGPSLASLNAQARVLCPAGYETLRQWQRLHKQAADAGPVAARIGRVEETLGLVENGEAQLLVQCTTG